MQWTRHWKSQLKFTVLVEDVKALILELGLDADVLRKRFDDELRPYLAVAPDRTILTLELWMDEFFFAESG